MNAFTEAAAEAAVETPVVEAPAVEVTIEALVANFLAGNSAVSGDFTAADNVLSYSNTVVARRTPSGTVLMAANIASVDLNDALIAGVALSGMKFRRMAGFSRLLNPNDRLAELDSARFDDFAAVAELFGFEYTAAETESLAIARGFRERAAEFFTTRHTEEQARIRAEQKKIMAERAKKEAIDWDSGSGRATNSSVQGSGGGQRLRVRAGAKTARNKRVETSAGQELTYSQAKRAWDHATKYWHGGLEFGYRGQAELGRRNYSGYASTVTADRLHFGCQRVTRKEAERFAASQGWAQATPATAAA